ncbi:MAG TPA: hypothetical protein VKW08_04420 [Xanthobacteraceae bacterium]|jgi:hypothetical protein|nr:hypothetical protein [Xanthobacteraceae bacterium]
MDAVLAATALMAASAGQFQLAVAGSMLKMNFDASRSVANLINSAQQNLDSLANVASGIGGNVNITV